MKEYQSLSEINDEIHGIEHQLADLKRKAFEMERDRDYYPFNFKWAQHSAKTIFEKLLTLNRVGKAIEFYLTKEQQAELLKEFEDIIAMTQKSHYEAVHNAEQYEKHPYPMA